MQSEKITSLCPGVGKKNYDHTTHQTEIIARNERKRRKKLLPCVAL